MYSAWSLERLRCPLNKNKKIRIELWNNLGDERLHWGVAGETTSWNEALLWGNLVHAVVAMLNISFPSGITATEVSRSAFLFLPRLANSSAVRRSRWSSSRVAEQRTSWNEAFVVNCVTARGWNESRKRLEPRSAGSGGVRRQWPLTPCLAE